MILLDGKSLSEKIKRSLTIQIEDAKKRIIRPPGLATILIGEDKASQVYIKMKIKATQEIGIKSVHNTFPIDTPIENIYSYIRNLNNDPTIDGILIQLPFPSNYRQYENSVLNLIAPNKDVDGLHPNSIGLNTFGDETYAPGTPKGIIRLLEEYQIPIQGQEIVIVNRTNVIGKPLAMMFINRSGTVTICHSKTNDLDFHLKRADIIVVGVGHINFITSPRIKENVTIIDAGINRNSTGKLCGDVDFEDVKYKCKAITPVPGGVGPMTIAMLLENTYLAYMKQNQDNLKNT